MFGFRKAIRAARLRVTPLHSRRYRTGDRVTWHDGEMRGTVRAAPSGVRDGYRWLYIDADADCAPLDSVSLVPASLSRPIR